MNTFNYPSSQDIGISPEKIAQSQTVKQASHKITTDYYQLAIEQLSEFKFFQLCSEEEKQKIHQHLKILHYPTGHYIYTANQTCHEVTVILKGIIRTAWTTPEGKHHIYKFLPTGLLTNIVPVVTHQYFGHDHISHEPTVVATIPGDILLNILEKNPKVLYVIFQLICHRSHLHYFDSYYQSTQPLQIRLARELIYLVEFFSLQLDSNIKIQIKLSQENFAELLNTSRKNINKELSILAQQGIVKVRYHQIHVLDLEKLKDLIK
ncbi:Crp/Fnr family transcriptional regulator [Acinetobacter puyangensis]|uniref:cAMP-binding domain of CRP or a regulatory subunit of cAMP-dependent protein kinases n=1 Tax=Acinetobacter puyangensis TaxID=1096779 RepID=A0A240E2M7_9GAMM|nr:Crp/Fnr family transcriptional regulator [Acinetobacter puyangensis]SNX43024.1 cAMP-binding domain of CRP or a regulatory subunit of cAMP-dependent protein kinases [Acinetobacter puyangensis]